MSYNDDVIAVKRHIIDILKRTDKDDQVNVEQLLELLELKVEKRCTAATNATRVEKLDKISPPRKLGNPAVVGLAGFALTTFLLQCYNFGWITVGPVLWMGCFYGGMSQLIAGLLEYGNGNNFGFSAFTTYGAFWISFVCTVIANEYTKFTVDDTTLAFFLAAFGVYTLIMLIGSLRHNLALTFVFATLTLGFALLTVAHLAPEAPGHWPKMAGAGVLMACSLGALYLMAHLVLLESFDGRHILPVGRALLRDNTTTTTTIATKNDARKSDCVAATTNDPPVAQMMRRTADGATLIRLNDAKN